MEAHDFSSHQGRMRVAFGWVAAVAVAVTLLVFFSMDAFLERGRLIERLGSQALVIQDGLPAALVAGDTPYARSRLATFRGEPAVRSATIVAANGSLFVHLPLVLGAQPRTDAPHLTAGSNRYEAHFAGLTQGYIAVPIQSDQGRMGTILLDVDLAQLYQPLRNTLLCVVAAVLLATLAAYGLWTRFERQMISGPLRGLMNFLRQSWDAQDFGARVAVSATDGTGSLAVMVNSMLSELEKRGNELRAHRSELETRVRERTLRLDAAVVNAQETVERTEAASRAKSEFLARMSHEIRTPMNAVLGMTELLRHATPLDERQRRYADVIHQSGTALLGIINDILDFSKIEAGKLELDRAPFSLRSVVEDAVEILAEKAHSKHLELLCDIPAEVETAVFGDGQRIRQIVINLVGNAVKFTERGEVRIKVQHNPIDKHRSTYRFEVTDTGIGMKPENYGAIFESFAQEDNSTTRKYGGTGLGLAICKQLVELMGGEIGVTSAAGRGSTFHFSVVLENDPATARGLRPAVLKGTRVLVVDDNPRALQITAAHLKSWGVAVTEAKSAAVAQQLIEISRGESFDALVIDGDMPGLDGFTFVSQLRKTSDCADIPILVLVSISNSSGAQENLERPTGWISKPVRRAELHAALVSLLTPPSAATTLIRSTSKRLPVLASTPRQHSRVRRALIVEDNPVNQELTQAMLVELGVQSVSAWSGEEALVKMAAQDFDVVLMDCQMPKLDGYATTRRVREWESRTGRDRTAIVAVTANALNGDASRCFAAGMDRYLSKPFTIDQLLGVLDSCVAEGTSLPEGGAKILESAVASPAETCSVAVLDAQTLEQIRKLERGVPNLLAKIVELYVDNSTLLLAQLQEALNVRNADGIGKAAHALKSTSLNAGASELGELCATLEQLGFEARFGEASTTLGYVTREHARVKRALHALAAVA